MDRWLRDAGDDSLRRGLVGEETGNVDPESCPARRRTPVPGWPLASQCCWLSAWRILYLRCATAEESMTVADQVYEQAKQLPEPLAREALDFVLFLRERQERGEWRDLIDAQSVALTAVWDNPDDEAWNNV
jgi:hypothetical protein